LFTFLIQPKGCNRPINKTSLSAQQVLSSSPGGSSSWQGVAVTRVRPKLSENVKVYTVYNSSVSSSIWNTVRVV